MADTKPLSVFHTLLHRTTILFLILVGLALERVVEMPFRIAMALDQIGQKGTPKDE